MSKVFQPINRVYVSVIAPWMFGAFVAIGTDHRITKIEGNSIVARFQSTIDYREKEIWQSDIKAAKQFGELVALQLGLKLENIDKETPCCFSPCKK